MIDLAVLCSGITLDIFMLTGTNTGGAGTLTLLRLGRLMRLPRIANTAKKVLERRKKIKENARLALARVKTPPRADWHHAKPLTRRSDSSRGSGKLNEASNGGRGASVVGSTCPSPKRDVPKKKCVEWHPTLTRRSHLSHTPDCPPSSTPLTALCTGTPACSRIRRPTRRRLHATCTTCCSSSSLQTSTSTRATLPTCAVRPRRTKPYPPPPCLWCVAERAVVCGVWRSVPWCVVCGGGCRGVWCVAEGAVVCGAWRSVPWCVVRGGACRGVWCVAERAVIVACGCTVRPCGG
jgi:hypothetical protein